MDKSRQYYLAALLLGLLFHGTVMSFTVEQTYDAYVHMFFAEHYASNWFETWNYKWYTGFTMTSYPPLVHQLVALLSKVIGLKAGFICWGMVAVLLFVRGVYHFSMIWVSREAAGYAALLAVVSSSFIEALHLFGQLPSITGMAFLLNACPLLYRWIVNGQRKYFYGGLSVIAAITAAHHVTTIFGMVFFVLPVLGVAVLDRCISRNGGIDQVRFLDFVKEVWDLKGKAILLGVSSIALTALIIFPYWYWSKTDPITQVSIPHGSRADFLAEPNLGLVFFIIPWGLMLFFLPGIIQGVFKKRNLFLGLSFILAFLLGTGGTTFLPRFILGDTAFNILTLDRFTFWATIMALPFFGRLIHSLAEGSLKEFLYRKAPLLQRAILFFTVVGILITSGLIINIGSFRPLQPDKIEAKPIKNFLERDGHDDYRYMTLGFGDQVAWIAAQTDALSVDGNYHSARRLPEMTTRAVERLENSKYLGMEGLGALQQFLAVPGKYHLKYIFSNDKFYEPLLYFYGWTRLSPLENNIDVWERKDVLPLPSILPKKDIPRYQKLIWGILPLLSLFLAFVINLFLRYRKEGLDIIVPSYKSGGINYWVYSIWFGLVMCAGLFAVKQTVSKLNPHRSPEQLLGAYFHHIDFKEFESAYQLYADNQGLSLEQFILELSLEDGMLASYAKLDAIDITQTSSDQFKVVAKWITAVKSYTSEHVFDLVENKDGWFIKKDAFEKKTPPDQFLRIAEVDFFNQGRRKATTATTIREDILDRPEVYIDEARLISEGDQYHVVGHIINVDNDPAFVNIDVTLYDDHNQEILRYAASDELIHNLLPKEGSYFRIDFEDVIWQTAKSKFPDYFDPEQKSEFVLPKRPHHFVLNVSTSVTDERLYKFYGVSFKEENAFVSGRITNYGNQELAVPQLLIAQNDEAGLKWVAAHYLPKGIRPQRDKEFEIALKDLSQVEIVAEGSDTNLLVNAVPRKEMRTSIPKERINATQKVELQVNALVNFKD